VEASIVRVRGGPQLKTVSLANTKEICVGSCIRIKWLTGDARGYTDEFPVAGVRPAGSNR